MVQMRHSNLTHKKNAEKAAGSHEKTAGSRGFAQQVREAMMTAARPGEPVTVDDIARLLDRVGKADKRPIYQTLTDMVRRGEASKHSPGRYFYHGKPAADTRKNVMWRLLRARRIVTVEDLVELAGVSEGYAKEWLHMLMGHGVIRRVGRRFQLLTDPGPAGQPDNTAKTERLRRVRLTKKRVLEEIARAEESLAIAKLHVMGLPEDPTPVTAVPAPASNQTLNQECRQDGGVPSEEGLQ